MATIDVFDIRNTKVSEMEIRDDVFAADVKEYLMHEAIKIQLANRRAGTVAVKNRSAVSGGGKSPSSRKAPAVHVRELSGLLTIPVAVWLLGRSQRHTTYP